MDFGDGIRDDDVACGVAGDVECLEDGDTGGDECSERACEA